MNSKFAAALLATSALAAVTLAAAPAEAKARKHSANPKDAEIQALRSEVKALTARLDADEAAQQNAAQAAQAAQTQAVNAQAAAAAAQTQAAAALGQSQAAQVQAASAAQAVPPLEKAIKTGWFGNTSISGKAFLNVSSIHQTSTDLAGHKVDNAQDGTQTELKRFYIGVDHKFNDVFSANITTDFRYNANGTSKDVLVYVKKAYLQAKLNPAFTVRVGAADLPWVPFVEGIYGYRFIENTLIDRTKFGTSSDWGVHVLGSLGPNNLVSYQVSAIDGAGYKTLSRSSNTIDLEGRVSINPVKPITLALGGYSGKLGKSNDTVNVNHRASRWDALAAYTDKRIRAGIEYFAATNWNNITTAPIPAPAPLTPNDKSHGWSAFGSFAFTPKVSLFGRYDAVKPTEVILAGTQGPARDHYFNLGLNYKPITPLDLALVYKHERTNNGFLSTSNGTIGGLDRGSYDEIGLFGQLVF